MDAVIDARACEVGFNFLPGGAVIVFSPVAAISAN
jgi:hypothetical protein